MLGVGDLPAAAPPSFIQLLKRFCYCIASLKLSVLPVEQQCCPCIFCTVVSPLLDTQPCKRREKLGQCVGSTTKGSTASTCVKPSKKLEGDKSLLGAVEQFHCIYHLLRGNLWVWLVGVVSDLDEGGVFSGECTRILMTLKSFLRPCPTNFTPFSSR